MLETIVTIILLPFAIGAVVVSGALLVGLIKVITKRKK